MLSRMKTLLPVLLVPFTAGSVLHGATPEDSVAAVVDPVFQKILARGPYFYTLCETVDADGTRGGVAFVDAGGMHYFADFDQKSGKVTQFVPFRRSGGTFSLGEHWGGDGAGLVIRDFLKRNSAVLDGQWRYGEGPIPTDELTAPVLARCASRKA